MIINAPHFTIIMHDYLLSSEQNKQFINLSSMPPTWLTSDLLWLARTVFSCLYKPGLTFDSSYSTERKEMKYMY